MKKSSTKKSLKSSGLALLVCIVMLIGTTFAWFTDSITNTGNKIEAGSLDIGAMAYNVGTDGMAVTIPGVNGGKEFKFEKNGRNLETSKDPIINDSLWEPGKSNAKLLEVTNNGSLAAKISLDFDVTNNDLQDALWFDFVMVDNSGSVLGNFEKRPMSDLQKVADAVEVKLGANETVRFVLVYGMNIDADNKYQGKTFNADVVIKATQLNREEDGFGNPDYDKDANPDVIFGAENIKDAMKDPAVKEVLLGEDINLNKEEFKDTYGNCTFVVENGKTLNLGGNDFIRPDGGSGDGLAIKSGHTAVVENGNVIAEGDMTTVDLAEGSTTTFKNVNFKGHGNELVRMRAKAGTRTTLIFKDCTFENAPVSLTGRDGATDVDVIFENCTFKGTYMMYGLDGKPLADKYGHIHYTKELISTDTFVCGSIELKDCTMNLDASEAKYTQSVIADLGCSKAETLEVTLDNVSIEGKNVIPVEVDSRYKNTVKIIEQGNNEYTVDGKSVNYDGTAK